MSNLPEMEKVIWIITKDYQYDEKQPMFESAVGVRSSNYPDGIIKIPACATKQLPYQFRMLDDDNEVYYQGFCSCNSSFAPLDDYGMPDSGCTSIQYLGKRVGYSNAKWVTL